MTTRVCDSSEELLRQRPGVAGAPPATRPAPLCRPLQASGPSTRSRTHLLRVLSFKRPSFTPPPKLALRLRGSLVPAPALQTWPGLLGCSGYASASRPPSVEDAGCHASCWVASPGRQRGLLTLCFPKPGGSGASESKGFRVLGRNGRKRPRRMAYAWRSAGGEGDATPENRRGRGRPGLLL